MEKLLAALALLPFGLGLSLGTGAEAPQEEEVVFAFADPAIIESSGLAVQNGRFATVNDSGDSGRVFTVDPADGRTVAVTTWATEPYDVEAMALLPDGDVLVGDIGDNLAARDSIELIRVPFGQDGAVEPTTYELAYPDGAHDAETLLVHPETGQVMVVAKEFIGQLYAAPTQLDPDRPNRLEPVGEVLPGATDGAFFPDGKHLIVRAYVKAAVYAWPSLDQVGENFFLPEQEQGEGLAVDQAGKVYLSSEGEHSEVLRIDLPEEIQSELDGGGEKTEKPVQHQDDRSDTAADADESAESAEDEDRPLWPWMLGGVIGVLMLVVLVRALLPR